MLIEKAEPIAHAARERASPRRLALVGQMIPEREGQLRCHDRPLRVRGEVEALCELPARVEEIDD
jgi:hypothetical protein